jgi:hypothetical protein
LISALGASTARSASAIDGAGIRSMTRTEISKLQLGDTPAMARPRLNKMARERRVTSKAVRDWFRTPRWATEALMQREVFPGDIWECAAGDGAMADPIAAAGYNVVTSDIEPQRAGIEQGDFLETRALPQGCLSIITNPPFKLGGEFVRHALGLGAEKVAIIQRVAFLEGLDRHQTIFGPTPPARVWVFSRRVTMWAGEAAEQREKGGAMAFAWFVWESGHTGDTALRWIA